MTRAKPWSLTSAPWLLGFFVIRVLAAGVAELRELEPPGGGLLVLGGRVVAVLAIRALEGNDLAHWVVLLVHRLTSPGIWPATSADKQLVQAMPDTPQRRA
jgi:hypothetical protein